MTSDIKLFSEKDNPSLLKQLEDETEIKVKKIRKFRKMQKKKRR